ncbi:ArsR family transcriptional regulator [Patescibacteria group bacterium]|nr:MAG: ArsR family transcriptional regulator [Patescibacteria group bacterium]
MKESNIKSVERLLKALANYRRLAIVKLLRRRKEITVGDIADEIKLSFTATSKHLGVLYNADIVEKEQISLQMWYRFSRSASHIAKYISNSLE